MTTIRPFPGPPLMLLSDFLVGSTCYALTGVPVLLGVLFGLDYLQPSGRPSTRETTLLNGFLRYDAQHYKDIAANGYSYTVDEQANVAFFPAYPLMARAVAFCTGWPMDWALLIVSQICLCTAFVLLRAYARHRILFPACQGADQVVLSFGFLPITVFMRMGYSESLFVCLVLLILIGMERGWKLWSIIFVTGLATAARPVGVALVPLFVYYVWNKASTWPRFLAGAALTPLAFWGLAAYMIYQWQAFDDPLAFAKVQDFWRVIPKATFSAKLQSLLWLEPIWGAYTPSSPRFWANYDPQNNPLFSLIFANAIVFVLCVEFVLYGTLRGWISRSDCLLSAGLLLIPYATKGYENAMFSTARFTSVVVPMYLVLGRLLAVYPPWLTSLFLGIGAFLLGIYAALFAANYNVF
jgi:hypothetical protein